MWCSIDFVRCGVLESIFLRLPVKLFWLCRFGSVTYVGIECEIWDLNWVACKRFSYKMLRHGCCGRISQNLARPVIVECKHGLNMQAHNSNIVNISFKKRNKSSLNMLLKWYDWSTQHHTMKHACQTISITQ